MSKHHRHKKTGRPARINFQKFIRPQRKGRVTKVIMIVVLAAALVGFLAQTLMPYNQGF